MITFRRLKGAACAASLPFLALVAAPASAQDAPASKTLWEKTDGNQNAVVWQPKTTCSLQWTDTASSNAFSFAVGKTIVTSQFSIMASGLNHETGDELTLFKRTQDGMEQVRTRFSRGYVGKLGGQVFYRHGTSLMNVAMDFTSLKTIGGFMLTPSREDASAAVVAFDGVLRDEAVEELGKCIATLPSHWSLEKDG